MADPIFPEQRHMMPLTQVRRERLLPENVLDARVEIASGARVGLRDVVARGAAPAPFVLVDAARALRLRRLEALPGLLQVEPGTLVAKGEPIARRRRRRVLAPITGRVVSVAEGRILMQEEPDNIELEAGLNGQVIEVRPGAGVVIDTYGAVLQGVWGNGRRAVGTLRIEPSEGMEYIFSDTIDMQYRGVVLVTRRPLLASSLDIIDTQGFAGVVAPSISYELIPRLLEMRCAVLIVTGFGFMRMSAPIMQFLNENDGRQAMIDAATPDTAFDRSPGRPEVIITVPLPAHDRPGMPLTNVSLTVGMQVRVVRIDATDMPGSGEGQGSLAQTGSSIGTVTALPERPQLLDNGLAVKCAEVELVTGERLTVPLANIEITGR
jgi:hypothetical protein